MADALDARLTSTTQKIGDLLRKYSFLLKPIPVADRLEGVAAGVGSAMSTVSLDQLREQIGSILRQAKKRVVVLIDDIDRLDKSEIQSVFRIVKLTADFDNVSYVLAFDEEMVAASLGERYSANAAEYRTAGTKFLEKIVQVGLHLPPASAEELRRYVFELIEDAIRSSGVEITQKEADEFARNFTVGLAPKLSTPRMGKRYANSLEFSLSILRGEVNVADLMLIEGIRTFYPSLYIAIRNSKALLLGGVEKGDFDVDGFIRKNSLGLSEAEEKGLIDLLQSLFPRTKRSRYPEEWEDIWSKEKRICSSHYFDRFFSYAVKSNDVSDYSLDEVLKLDTISQVEFNENFQALLSPKNAAKLISKLRSREKTISPTAARRVSVALVGVSSRLPASPGMFGMAEPFTQGAMFVSQLLKQIPEEERPEVAIQILSACETPAFVAECMKWMSVNSKNEPRKLSVEAEQEMRRFGAELLLRHLNLQERPIFESEPDNAAKIMNAIRWGLGEQQLRTYVSRCLELYPASAISLIRAFAGFAQSMETGLRIEPELHREQYDAIVAVADREQVASALVEVFGDGLGVNSFYTGSVDHDRNIAHQFIWINNLVLADEAKQEDQTGHEPQN